MTRKIIILTTILIASLTLSPAQARDIPSDPSLPACNTPIEADEMHDSKGTKYSEWLNTWIGGENTERREIIASVPVRIMKWLRVPVSKAGEYPTIARVTFTFNDKRCQYRNIKVEDRDVWEGLRDREDL
ncbi:MAG: hypothetical protein IJG37_03135 [Synergistaceae bacterium]|nr:hypothetical protein [Synergistaceae bacterium]MBQ3653522.1 hypothetical protein [Synergistaceae bacterium]